jgi:hypothetical protein
MHFILNLLLRITFVCTITFLLPGCSKNSNDNDPTSVDSIAPQILVNSPASNQQYSEGQMVLVDADANDNIEVTEFYMYVSEKISGSTVRHIHLVPLAKEANMRDSFAAKSGLDYVIKIYATDANQNLATKQVEVSTIN